MHLAQFLNSCAYLCFVEDGFLATCELAGIDWQKLPEFESVKSVREFLFLLTKVSRHEALVEMRDHVRRIELEAECADLGRNEHEIAAQFKKLYSQFKFVELGRQLMESPERGQRLLDDFTFQVGEPTRSYLVGDFAPMMYLDFLEKTKIKEARQAIDGFPILSETIGGFNKKRIIMIMGETGFGKTNLAMNLAVRAALRNKCLYVNMEMSLEDMTKRLAVLVTRQSYRDLYLGHIPFESFRDAVGIFGMSLMMTSGSALTMGSIEALIRKQAAAGLDFVFIDYDQKIDLPYMRGEPEWKSLQKAILKLEDLAKELNVCMIVLAQVNRDGDISASHRATFSAHTILDFRNDETHGPVIAARKNRHGKKDQAVRVRYSEEDSSIQEIECVTFKVPKPKGPNVQRKI